MRILVTGGAGFIGSHVVDELVGLGHPVRVLDDLHGLAHPAEPDYLNPGAEYVWGDVREPAVVAAALEGIDAVSHQAAMVGLGVDMGDVAEYVSHNSLGTATLLGEMHRAGFGGRLVLAASMVVYGEGRYRCEEHGLVVPGPRRVDDLDSGEFEPRCPVCDASLEAEPVPETAPADPRNVYAATKLNQEHLCAAYSREHGNPAVALRYHNVYGPRMPRDTPYAGVASIFRSALERGRCAAGVRGRGPDARLRPRPRRGQGERARADRRRGGLGPVQYRLRLARAASARWQASWPLFWTARSRRRPASTGSATSATSSPRSERARDLLGFEAAIGFAEGVEEFASAPLRAAQAAPGAAGTAGATSLR